MKKIALIIGFLGVVLAIYLKNDSNGALSSDSQIDIKQPFSEGSALEQAVQAEPEFGESVESVISELQVDAVNSSIPLFEQESAYLRNDPRELFPDAETLATPGLSEAIYVESLHSLLDEYVIIVKAGGYPTGLNVEITNALLGKNKKKIAFLPDSHPRINTSGELVDQWGSPYYFHLQSLRELTVHSAGPDRKMYTEDDVLSTGESMTSL